MRKPDQSVRANSPSGNAQFIKISSNVSVMLNPGFKAASRDLSPSDWRLSSSLKEKDVQDANCIVDVLKFLTLEYN